jgi:peroxiredoxin Q/BCP
MGLKRGDTVPSVILKDKDNKSFNTSNFKGEKAVVIYFYPKNFTSECTKEACEFRDSYQDFKDLGAEVIAISADSEASHSKFVNKFNLPFIFLSDKNKEARKAFGVQSSLLGLVPGRETFIFDKKGILRMRFNNMFASGHTEKALEKLKILKDEEV